MYQRKLEKSRINEEIDVSTARLIGANGEQVGIVPIEEALKEAKSEKLDLVEIAPWRTRSLQDIGLWEARFEAKKGKAAAKKNSDECKLRR